MMELLALLLVPALVVSASGYLPPKQEAMLTEALLREISGGLMDPNYLDLAESAGPVFSTRNLKDLEALDYELDQDSPGGPGQLMHPSIRDKEYQRHQPGSVWGHQYLSGGAGEGKQRLGPDGSIENSHQVKSDAGLPAYCTPPNPCPIGYTAEDGCLENFENTAAFSREFQAAQDCMCDQEHMFKCPGTQTTPSAHHNGITEADIDRFVHEFQGEGTHKTLVAKKFHVKKSMNPYLQGERLPVAAKKGFNIKK